MKKKTGKHWFVPFVQTTILECPECGNKLKSPPGENPPLYACPKCGYHSPIGLKPKGKKVVKKK